jgi:tRNA modification GTPase
LGIARSREALADAALVLIVLDAAQPLHDDERVLIAGVASRAAIVVMNKSDLAAAESMASLAATGTEIPIVRTSALSGEGLPELRERILALATGGASSEPGMLTSLRHHQAVSGALDALADAALANTSAIPHEMILLDLYRALWALDSLTGATTPDDILNLIFSTFCIGK